MNTRYAEGTTVPVDRSRTEIERILARYGASSFMYGWDTDKALIGFIAHDRQVRFTLPMPDRSSRGISRTPTGRARTSEQIQAAYEQAVRQRWRALALVIKAKLEAVSTGIVSFEDEFAMHVMLPSGQSVGEWLTPQIDRAYQTGDMPALLPATPRAIEP
jgi:hypothetical protein